MMLYNHFENIWNIPRFKNAIQYVYIEAVANWDLVDGRAKLLIGSFGHEKMKVVRRDPTGARRFGVYTGTPQKNQFNSMTKQKLAEATLYWCSLFTTIGDDIKTEKEAMYRELQNFRLIVKEPLDEFGVEKTSLSGKHGNGSKKDDRVLSLGICMYNAVLTLLQSGYETGLAK